MEPDFSGWATKNGLKCADGLTIMGGAFKHQDKMQVPLVWSHQHNDVDQVLGHAILENRPEGVYAYGYFNESDKAQSAKAAVKHGDVESLSIYANRLQKNEDKVIHGVIREVSLVLAGANPGALIDNVYIRHGDEVSAVDGEAIIYTDDGLVLHHSDVDGEVNDDEDVEDDDELDPKQVQEVMESLDDDQKEVVHALLDSALNHSEEPSIDPAKVQSVYSSMTEDQQYVIHSLIGDALMHASNTTEGVQMTTEELSHAETTVQDVVDSMSEEQKNVMYFLVGEAAKNGGSAAHADSDPTELIHSAIKEGFDAMSRNVFEQNDTKGAGASLSHDQLSAIFADASKGGGTTSFKETFLSHAATYGIEDIDTLFPDAKSVMSSPEFISRRMEWVNVVLTGTKHSPIARIKTVHADITADEARARGYVKGNLKKEEVFKLLKRKTEPTTIYKKQKLDRDDIIDITDLDVVAWIKAEMRIMLDEEIARAILIGDGRDVSSEDKIDEERLRPIATDDDMYAHKVTLQSNASVQQKMDQIVRTMDFYKGSGSPVMFTTRSFISDMLLERDRQGRKLYNTRAEIAATLQVSNIIDVEVMEQHEEVVAVIVNLQDYTIGADKGGSLSMFDDFDIDYNQFKYLIETRISGALTKAKSAIVIKREVGVVVTPLSPSFDSATNTVTYPGTAGVVYRVDGVPVSGSDVISTTTEVNATPATGYSFPNNVVTSWTFVPSAG